MKIIVLVFAFLAVFQCSDKKEQSEDYSFNDIWVLEELADFDFSIEGNKGNPTLKVNLEEKTYGGHTGCNVYHGSFKLSGNKVTFLPALITKMACDDNGLEKAYLAAIKNVDNFTLSELGLQLLKGDKILAVFKKEE